MDPEATTTSRNRLLAAGKSLFAKNGYEQTSTAAIAREAMTSESQLIRNFGGKAGLLLAIFDQSWKPLTDAVQQMAIEATNARDAIFAVTSLMIDTFGRDPDIAFLLLFEGRRIRGEHEVALSQGFQEFARLIRALIRRAQAEGSLGREFSEAALASALMGAAEGMIRDRLTAARAGQPDPFTSSEIEAIFMAISKAL